MPQNTPDPPSDMIRFITLPISRAREDISLAREKCRGYMSSGLVPWKGKGFFWVSAPPATGQSGSGVSWAAPPATGGTGGHRRASQFFQKAQKCSYL